MRPVGDHAVLLELPDNATVHAAARVMRERFGEQLAEVVPGHVTLLLVWDEGLEDPVALMSNLNALAADASAFKSDTRASGSAKPREVTIPVRYDGADLETAASTLRLGVDGLVSLHSAAAYTVAFTGFSPGFPYLRAASRQGDSGGDDERGDVQRLLELPRLATPRTEVPAGSVAVAAGYCGIYPRSSPGGWNLLGHTDVVLFDAQREPPALLEPGTQVRFEPI